jgi:hypothetical protein
MNEQLIAGTNRTRHDDEDASFGSGFDMLTPDELDSLLADRALDKGLQADAAIAVQEHIERTNFRERGFEDRKVAQANLDALKHPQ